MLYFAKWKITLITALCLLGVVFSFPNFLSYQAASDLPGWLPSKQVNLGLDLQGGSHLLLEVDVNTVINERLDALVDNIRTALRKEKIGYTKLGVAGGGARFRLTDPLEDEKAKFLLREIDPGLVITMNDNAIFNVTYDENTLREIRTSAVNQSIEIVRRRIDETGTREPTIQRQGEDRILIQLPGIKDPERIKSLLGKTAKLTLHLVDSSVSADSAREGKVPPGSIMLPSGDPTDDEPFYVVRKRVVVSGDRLENAAATMDQRSAQWVVTFNFDTLGAKKFGKASSENVGKRLAVVLDGKVISAPVVREAILGGSGQISGRFTPEAARDLALLLRAGALPAPLTILEERSVGPSLGADSIAAGKIACLIGFLAVAIFMIIIYGFFGIVADIALVLNLMMILGALSVLQATLTLPGIAGIVLTVGMAVDANVLIFEHIREEVRAGRTPFNAIEAGYKRAFTTIVDANVTTLIAALLLYEFGSGPIKGFAVTLSIGILTSMFTAIMVTRLLIVTWLRRRRPDVLPI